MNHWDARAGAPLSPAGSPRRTPETATTGHVMQSMIFDCELRNVIVLARATTRPGDPLTVEGEPRRRTVPRPSPPPPPPRRGTSIAMQYKPKVNHEASMPLRHAQLHAMSMFLHFYNSTWNNMPFPSCGDGHAGQRITGAGCRDRCRHSTAPPALPDVPSEGEEGPTPPSNSRHESCRMNVFRAFFRAVRHRRVTQCFFP